MLCLHNTANQLIRGSMMKFSFKTRSLIAGMGLASAALLSGAATAAVTVEAGLPDYQKASGISGNGVSFQISALYSRMVRSVENLPLVAVFIMLIRVQRSAS